MKRIFGTYAYGDTPIEACYWAEAVPEATLHRPPLQWAVRADVVVIGGGFTGLSAALHLAQGGASVVLLESRYPGWGASGRNGGFCCLGGSKLSDQALDGRVGRDGRLAWRQTEKAAVGLVADLLAKHRIEAETHSDGETILAHRPSAARFEGEARRVEENYGVTPHITAKDALVGEGLNAGFHGAMTIPIGFGLHPRKYLAGLLQVAEEAGATVHGESPVTAIQSVAGRHRVSTAQGHVDCNSVILATNGYSSEDIPEWMAARYMPAQSSVIVTRPLTEEERAAQGWTSYQASYDTRNLLHYFRLMPDNRFLFGMRGGLTASPRSEAGIKRLIRRDFEAMFPAWRHVETPHYWSGMVCLAPGFAPFCGEIPYKPGFYAGYAYHGNGVAMGSYTGALLADLVLGKGAMERPAIMQTPPSKFPLGRFRRAAMFPAYAGFWLGDRIG
ncbi:NAD(P)/FAD-dependent oxidoreductase [Rhodalgimonas zhirmunskyi]|uniref:FAD-binding oxidoreductase n=1 Tax=Rhodalgimonas zhirmunskyi TaxID=2964767 RepID=A0AAJ1U6B7_9RHOB|nr:FAD-dependent oxidoreductase [Rhodoalgimonas zhirmunskyi]MDQ2094405.1 FAD-binding oxidoreductase [Rhodoalgimonas zhirmunskyi]